MYFPKTRSVPPEGYVDKFDAADYLGLHPEVFLSRIRNKKIAIEPLVSRGQQGARIRHYYAMTDLERVKTEIDEETRQKKERMRAARELNAKRETRNDF